MKYFSLLPLLLLFSCTKDECPNEMVNVQTCFDKNIKYAQNDANYREYIENLTYWKCLGIDNYEITYTSLNQVCSGGVFRLRVIDGKIVETTELPSMNPYIHQHNCNGIGATVEGLYSTIQTAVDSSKVYPYYPFFDPRDYGGLDSLLYVADRINISYDTAYYFPDSIYIDPIMGVADEEFSIILSDFEEIN